jgi:hypothetical protein
MTKQVRREFAPTIIIDDQDRFLLQQRDDIAGIFYPGKIGLFGGHREGVRLSWTVRCVNSTKS